MSGGAAQGDFLAAMAAASAKRSAAGRSAVPERELRRRAEAAGAVLPLRLGAFGLIAEVKTASPSEGVIARDERRATSDETGAGGVVVAQARAYAAAGVAAISVLTEPSRFGGEPGHLVAAAGAVRGAGVPCMRKDFLVDPYQVIEARAWGAGGVLLIVRMLEDAVLRAMLETADGLGLFTLLEAFDERDLERAGELLGRVPGGAGRAVHGGPVRLVGVNTRDLVTLKVEPERLERLVGRMPAGVPRVAESGLATAEDAGRVAGMGYDAALVGTALMRSAEPARLAAAMVAAGSAARSGGHAGAARA